MSDLEALDRQIALKAVRYLRDHDEYAPSWARFRHVYDDRAKVGRGPEFPKMLEDLPPRMDPAASAGYRERIAVKHTERKLAAQRAKAILAAGPSRWTPLRSEFAAITPMLTYTEVYQADGQPYPEVANQVGEMQALVQAKGLGS